VKERSRSNDRDFDFTDGPTELPGPWTPPPDPDFATGTVPLLEAVDLGAGLDPRLEPADSVRATMQISRDEMQSLMAARLDARDTDPAPPPVEIEPLPAPAAEPREVRRAEVMPPPEPAAEEPAWRRLLDRHFGVPHLAIAFAVGLLAGLAAAL
jgi:hypothetical protein